ncbi:MAG: hypothetical protein PVH84_06580 [Candidatus Aminicenantes bacterium]|jgi:hypothetical protein
MKILPTVFLIIGLCLIVSCGKQKSDTPEGETIRTERVTLPDIDISRSPDGIVTIPENVPQVFRDVFVKYTKIYAPNGKPIHILAQGGWTDDQIKKGRNVLEFILTDFPSSEFGNDKSAIANAMADRKATMVFFNTEPDLRKAFRGPLRGATDLSMQDLRANECPAEGDDDYMNHVTRDASFEEIWHLVHDYGVKQVLPDMVKEMRAANDLAAEKGWQAWPEDEPDEHPNEYVGVLIDNYYDLWTVRPKLYEGRDISPEDVPAGQSHFGRYFAGSRIRMKEHDPAGYALIQKFFPPYLTYTPELPGNFEGAFSLNFDESMAYTYKSQHLVNVTLTGTKNADLVGNAYDNVLTGNAGDNVFTGGGGNDMIDGGKGKDTAVFTGPRSDYFIRIHNGDSTVTDSKTGRDGEDSLRNVEILKFSDETVEI